MQQKYIEHLGKKIFNYYFSIYMKYGSIAAGDKTTVNAAMEILKDGGNAFDAAVCAVFTAMTSEYTLLVLVVEALCWHIQKNQSQ